MAADPHDPRAARPRGLYGQRASRSADASRRLEFERLAQMSAYERVLLALELKQRGALLGLVGEPSSAKGGGG